MQVRVPKAKDLFPVDRQPSPEERTEALRNPAVLLILAELQRLHYSLRTWQADSDDLVLRKARKADGVKSAIEVIGRILQNEKAKDEED